MKLLLSILIGVSFYNTIKAQSKEYNLLLCKSYHTSFTNNSILKDEWFLPSKYFDRIYPKNIDNLINGLLDSWQSIKDPVLCESYFLFYDPELKLNDLYSLGIIHFPFFINSAYVQTILRYGDQRSINAHCMDFEFHYCKDIFYTPNITGLQFSMNMFNTEFYDLFPLYPISIACIPVKLYGEIQKCNTTKMNIPNWNRNSASEPMTLHIDSVSIYKISKFDSIAFYRGHKIISTKNKKCLVVNSNDSYMENIKYYRIINRKYLKSGKYNKNNSVVFKSDKKLSFYFNIY